MDPEQDRRIADRGPPALGRPECTDEVAERHEVVGLVGDDEVLRVEAERVGQRLTDLGVVVADPHVLVHHALTGLLREEVPVRALDERVDDEVARALAGEERLLLLGRLPNVLRRPDPADERVGHGQPAAETGPKRRRSRRLQDVDGRGHPPQQGVDAGLEADRRVADRADGVELGGGDGLVEPAAVFPALLVRSPSPGRVEPEAERLHVGLVAGAHCSSRIHVARSAAA